MLRDCKVEFTKMTNKIKHLGIVESIEGLHVKVRILQVSACSTCSIKGHCNASDMKEKLIDAYNTQCIPFNVGERVMVCGTASMGMKAVLLAFAMPFVLLMFSLFIVMSMTGGDELLSAIVSLCTLVPYYLIIYKVRNKMGKTFSFTVESLNY